MVSIYTNYAEKVAAQMSKTCRPNGPWAVLMDNPGMSNTRLPSFVQNKGKYLRISDLKINSQ